MATAQEVEAWMNVVWKVIVAGLLGSIATAIPLWFQIRKLNRRFKTEDSKQESKERINHEAEWKRIIEFRDAEMTRLRERDDQQEKKITELYAMNLECQKSEARSTERISNLEKQNALLTEKLARFEEIILKKGQ